MLIRLVTLKRRSASDAPQECPIAIDPEMIARIEEESGGGLSQVWCDGMNGKPYIVRGTVDEVLATIQAEVDKQCGPVLYDTQ
jgi:uncharacterized protein YlzI (FlbEa/FlbD family)